MSKVEYISIKILYYFLNNRKFIYLIIDFRKDMNGKGVARSQPFEINPYRRQILWNPSLKNSNPLLS